MEIERKFLLPDASVCEGASGSLRMEQVYLCADPVVRARRVESPEGQEFILTVKGKGLVSREELEWKISEETYEMLAGRHIGRTITKTRYLKPLDEAHTLEIDVFEGELSGLVLAEIEFADAADCASFAVPAYLTNDVSEEPLYKNVSLALSPSPLAKG